MKLRVALAAQDAAGVQVLKLLARRGHEVAAIYTSEPAAGPGATVAAAAQRLEIPARSGEELRDPALADRLAGERIDLLLNVHSLHIVATEVLGVPALGAYNLHPGPLPERAGLNSPSWALYEGDRSHGVTLHRMTAGVDEGPVAFAERFPVGEDERALAVLSGCVRRGVELVGRLLDRGERGEPIPAEPQDLSRRRWFGAGPPDDGALDWSRLAAREVVDFVRACDYRPFPSPWGFPRSRAGAEELGIVAAELPPGEAGAAAPRSGSSPAGQGASPGTVAAAGEGGVDIRAAEGLVRVTRVEVAGRQLDPVEVLKAGDSLAPSCRRSAGRWSAA